MATKMRKRRSSVIGGPNTLIKRIKSRFELQLSCIRRKRHQNSCEIYHWPSAPEKGRNVMGAMSAAPGTVRSVAGDRQNAAWKFTAPALPITIQAQISSPTD
jgi:hypothetical protein